MKRVGTTTLGIICNNGIIFASEHHATMDTFIASKTVKKIYKIDEHIEMAVSGVVGHSQYLLRQFTAKIYLYSLENGYRIPLKAAATLLSNLLRGENAPYYVQLILGGWNGNEEDLCSIDDVGGMIGDEYIVAGCSQHAYGVFLEDRYKKDLSIDEGIDIILSALNAVTKRDSASGDGIEISIIDKQGYKILEEGVIKNRLHILEGNHG